MIGDPLQRTVGAAVVDAVDRGPRQAADVVEAGQFVHDRVGPGRPWQAADLVGLGEQAAARSEVLVRQDHPRPGPARGQRRHQAGRPGADHQEVAEGVGLLVGVGIGRAGQAAEAGGAADQRLVDLLPEGGGPHEGLVVEARGQEGRQQIVGAGHIEAQRGPAVLAGGLEAVVKLDHRGLGVRLAART